MNKYKDLLLRLLRICDIELDFFSDFIRITREQIDSIRKELIEMDEEVE